MAGVVAAQDVNMQAEHAGRKFDFKSEDGQRLIEEMIRRVNFVANQDQVTTLFCTLTRRGKQGSLVNTVLDCMGLRLADAKKRYKMIDIDRFKEVVTEVFKSEFCGLYLTANVGRVDGFSLIYAVFVWLLQC